MNKKITIGSRGSKLALLYAQKAKDTIIQNSNLNDEDIFIKTITTQGDQVKDSRLSEFGGKGLFSNNIERELQNKKEEKLLNEKITKELNLNFEKLSIPMAILEIIKAEENLRP